MKIVVCGDTHGRAGSLIPKLEYAKALGADRVFVVGDFGMWPGLGGIEFFDGINRRANTYGIKIYALPGNHEDHDQWEWWLDSSMPKKDGFTYIRSNILISPKVHNFKWDGKRFFVAGGAVSIDRMYRKTGLSWWPNEELTEEETQSIEKYSGPSVDYLLTHDCSDFTPWAHSLVADPASKSHRDRIDRVIAAVKPQKMFHGHMHHKYQWTNVESHGSRPSAFGTDNSKWNGHATKTYGLDCDGERFSWGLLDTETDKFLWSNQLGF